MPWTQRLEDLIVTVERLQEQIDEENNAMEQIQELLEAQESLRNRVKDLEVQLAEQRKAARPSIKIKLPELNDFHTYLRWNSKVQKYMDYTGTDKNILQIEIMNSLGELLSHSVEEALVGKNRTVETVLQAVEHVVLKENKYNIKKEFKKVRKHQSESVEKYTRKVQMLGRLLKRDDEYIRQTFIDGMPQTASKSQMDFTARLEISWADLIRQVVKLLNYDDMQTSLGKDVSKDWRVPDWEAKRFKNDRDSDSEQDCYDQYDKRDYWDGESDRYDSQQEDERKDICIQDGQNDRQQCYGCGEVGHLEQNCSKKERKDQWFASCSSWKKIE